MRLYKVLIKHYIVFLKKCQVRLNKKINSYIDMLAQVKSENLDQAIKTTILVSCDKKPFFILSSLLYLFIHLIVL